MICFEKIVVFWWTKHSDIVCLFILLTQDTYILQQLKEKKYINGTKGNEVSCQLRQWSTSTLWRKNYCGKKKKNSPAKLPSVRFAMVCLAAPLFRFKNVLKLCCFVVSRRASCLSQRNFTLSVLRPASQFRASPSTWRSDSVQIFPISSHSQRGTFSHI